MSDWNKSFWLGGSKGGTQNETRYPEDDPEGVIGQYDENGIPITTGAISVTKIETLDLISEGKIRGLVSGYYIYSGKLGDIGYTGYEFKPYPVPAGATVNWLRSIYWNNVPLIDSSNKYNFSNIDVSYTKGLPNGSLVGSQNSELTVSRPLGERLRGPRIDEFGVVVGSQDDYTKTYRIYNNNCIGIFLNVKFGQLYKRNVSIGEDSEYGDVEITSVEYQIRYKPLFSGGGDSEWSGNVTQEKVEGKISFGYIKSTRVDFLQDASILNNKYFVGWEIEIKRLTEDSQDTTIANQTNIDSLTEIYGNKFSSPNSALVRCNFNAEFFSQVPERAFHADLLEVKIPSNYDPIMRKYTGDWDGTFATIKSWSNNPAWCFYDLVTNSRYGLGRYFTEESLDKWTLYKIGQYCDELVSDGFGNVEPRFTCNLYISSREEAIKVINDFVSIFRGMIYYAGGGLKVSQDAYTPLEECFIQFTEANVKDGDFNYTTAPRNTKNTVAIVRYNDKDNFFKPALERIENIDGIRKYGYRETEALAYGCTSRGQAIRYGNWLLGSDAETISFVASSEASLLKPGDIFKTYDSSRNNERLGGRVYSYLDLDTGRSLELDSNIKNSIATGYLTGNVYSLSLTIPTYIYDSDTTTLNNSSDISGIRHPQIQTQYFSGWQATGLNSGRTRINLTGKFELTGLYSKTYQPIWTVDLISGSGLYSSGEYWRTINVEENDLTSFKVLGINYTPSKYTKIDSQLQLTAPTTNISINETPSCPKDLGLNLVRADPPNVQHASPRTIVEITWGMNDLNNVDGFAIFITKDQEFTEESFGTGPNALKPIMIGLGSRETIGPYQYDYVIDEFGYYRIAVFSKSLKEQFSGSSNVGLSPCSVQGDVSITEPENDFYPVNVYGLVASNSGSGDDGGDGIDTPLSKGENETSVPSPYISWTYVNNTPQVDRSTFFRVSVREVSPTTLPSPVWYAEYTGLFPDATVEGGTLKFIFDIEKNTNITPPLAGYPRGPYRNYDIVVESHDQYGNSSAGGNFGFPDPSDVDLGLIRTINIEGLRDSTFTQGKGYDIARVSNPPITGNSFVYSTTGNFEGDAYLAAGGPSKQSLSVNLVGNFVYPDMRGMLLFYNSSGPINETVLQSNFDNDIAMQNLPINGFCEIEAPYNPVDINEYPISFYSEPIINNNISEGWCSYFLYDSFDEGARDQYPDRWRGFFTGTAFDWTRLSESFHYYRQNLGAEFSYAQSANVPAPVSFIESSDASGNMYAIPLYSKASITNSGFSTASDGLIAVQGFAQLRDFTNFYHTKTYVLGYGNVTGDALKGLFQYNSGVTNADDANNYIKPNSIPSLGTGRYVRLL